MSLSLPPFQYVSCPPYIVSFTFDDGEFRAASCETLPEALAFWFRGAPDVGEPDAPVLRLIRDAQGVVIFGNDRRNPALSLPLVITQQVLALATAMSPEMAAEFEEIEMLMREAYVLHGKDTG